MTTRGYPFGMHFGSDHRDPHVAVDKDFSCLSYRKIPYRLESIQVWGCGTSEQRHPLIRNFQTFFSSYFK